MRWAARDQLPLSVEGTGLLDCHLYRQPGRLVLHLVNVTSEATWRAPLDELIGVGPFSARVRLLDGIGGRTARRLAPGRTLRVRRDRPFRAFTIDAILDHEAVVLE